jgi:hypothetical protein
VKEADVAQKPITVAQLLLLVEERSASIEPGFAKAMRGARAAGLVEPNPHWAKSGKPSVPFQLRLTTLGSGAVEWMNERLATVKTLQEIAKRQPPGAFRTFLCDLADHFITGKHRGS